VTVEEEFVERSASRAQVSRDNATAHDFTSFYAEDYRALLALDLGLSPSSAEAEEHVQDALAVAYRSWDKVQFLESPGGWTRRVLPTRQAQAVALHYIDGHPVAEIAQILGVGSSTVKIHLQRGRAAIGRSLGIGGGS
jgi:DNA-directed RNA polymerase specialized sigma24 family protein